MTIEVDSMAVQPKSFLLITQCILMLMDARGKIFLNLEISNLHYPGIYVHVAI